MTLQTMILISAASAIVAFLAGYYVRRYFSEAKIGSAEEEAARILEEAKKEAESRQRELLLEAKEEVHQLRTEFEQESKERRSELQQMEKRLVEKERQLERKDSRLEAKEEQLKEEEDVLQQREKEISDKEDEITRRLERTAGMSREQAKEKLLRDVEEEAQHEAARKIRRIEREAKEEAERRAKDIISLAIQRTAADHVADTTVSVVELPNDEMKGRIIGREGRNIRAFEALTGVDLIIDDTPEAVVISGFSPIRREKARICLEKLIADGRIHPGHIEEMYEKAEKEMQTIIREAGEEATYEADVHGLNPELVNLLGRLKFRTSFGQNVLQHSLEVAHLAGIMAGELKEDASLARRAGLLHDIGKAVDHEREGNHVEIGVSLLKRHDESQEVIDAMSAHHGDYEPLSIVSVLVTAADALSAARPGARRETLEAYIKRLEKLEEIGDSFQGVEKAYAIQAGREIRVMVKPQKIDDGEAHNLARNLAKTIEKQLDYPGQIKVTVIRETRAVEYAQ